MNSKNNTVERDVFFEHKIKQQRWLWEQGQITTAQLVDYLLGYGTDADVEWLCANFDPLETIAKY